MAYEIFFLILLHFGCSFAASDNNEITNTFKLLKEGDEKILLKEEYKNVILVTGNTGAGKTTFIQWIAGDDSKLISNAISKNSREYLIFDNSDRIGNSTINSKTIFPELVIDKDTNEAYYDCPGFSDTRSVSHDIAGTYFIKKLTDHANGFKILLVVNYHSVREGLDRKNFLELMRHTTDFIKNIVKFRHSVAIIVTKVENHRYFDEELNQYFLEPDEQIIEDVALFLRNVKNNLKDRLENKDGYTEEEKFYRSAIKLLHILSSKDNETYSRIGIFRRPDKSGPISRIPLLQKGKDYIKQMIRERLKFTVKSGNDFGYTVSDKSKNEINNLVEMIRYKVRIDISDVISEIQQYCNNLLNQVNGEVDSFIDNTKTAKLDLQVHLRKIHDVTLILPILLKEADNSYDIEYLSDKILYAVTSLGINTPECLEKIKNIKTQGRYYNFLQVVYERKLEEGLWISYFHPIKDCLNDAKKLVKDISDKAEMVNQQIKSHDIKHLNEEEMEEYYRKKLNMLEIENVPAAASDLAIAMHNLISYRKYLELLKILKSGKSDTWPPKWIPHLGETVKRNSDSEKWYKFLGSLHADFSTFETQMNKNRFNVANIDDWGDENAAQGIQINHDNFEKFLGKFGIKYEYVKGLEMTEERLEELNHVLALTLRYRLVAECLKPGKLVIKGSYIKISDITTNDGKIKNFCNNSLALVDIFALDLLIIDRDFNGVGSKLQLSIVAQKWHVVGSRTINLDGFQPTDPPKANDGVFPSGKGSDGKPGLPGGPAGHFLGIAGEIRNGESLIITANGGPGGFGENGGNGGNGRDGEDATTYHYYRSDLRDKDRFILIVYNSVEEKRLYHGYPGGVGGQGGNGGVGGYGGFPGKIKVLNLAQSFHLSNIKNSQGPNGRGGKGGIGGKGGNPGKNLIASRCYKYLLFIPINEKWCYEYVYSSSNKASSGQNGTDDFNGLRQPPEKPEPYQNVPDILNNFKLYLLENLMDRFKRHSLVEFLKQLDMNDEVNNLHGPLGLANEYLLLDEQTNLQKLNKENTVYLYQSIIYRINQHTKISSEEHKKALGTLHTAALSKIYNLLVDSNPNLIIDIEQNLDLLSEDIANLRNLQENINKARLIDQYRDKYKSAINKKITEAESVIQNQIIQQIDDAEVNISNQIDLLIKEIIDLQEKTKGIKWELMQKKEDLGNTLTVSHVLNSIKNLVDTVKIFLQSGLDIMGVVGAISGENPTLEKLSNEFTFDSQKLENIIHSNATQSFINLYNKYENRKQENKALDDAIEKANQDIQKLERYEAEIRETAIPVIENMKQDMNRVVDQLDTNSQVTLEVNKWQVQKVLKDMKVQMRQFTKGFTVDEKLARCMESLEEVMTTLINVYDMMQNYQQQKELADYIADISSPKNSDADITDGKLWEAAKKIELSIRSNLIVKQYQIAIAALKQQTFPLVHLYLEEPMLPSHLMLENNFQNLVDKAVKQIGTVQRKIKEYKSSITQHDKYMNNGWFDSTYRSAKPFFVWKNEKHGDTIRNLLSGKKVSLKPDILVSHLDKDAIKFNIIGIHFSSSNSSVSSEINEKLKGYMLNATHLGNSYYRFNNKIYILTSSSQSILFSIEKDVHGVPVVKNSVYDKIKSGDLMLSPYTMWEMQLINIEGKTPFELEMYENNVDLELIGHGSFLTKGYNITLEDVEKYYKIDDDLSVLSYESRFYNIK